MKAFSLHFLGTGNALDSRFTLKWVFTSPHRNENKNAMKKSWSQ
jgi:hypothetical protein